MIELETPQDQQPVQEPVEIADVPLPQPLPAEAMKMRAKKFTEGLSELLGTTEESVLNDLMSGREEEVRLAAAHRLNERETGRRLELIQNLAKQRGKLTPHEYNLVMTNSPSFDPETAPEGEYAKYYMQVLEKPDTTLSDEYTERERDQAFAKYHLMATDYMTKREILQTDAENMAIVAGNQSWAGWIVDQLKGVIPLYNELKQRGNVPNVGYITGGLLQGENLEEQQRELFKLPVNQFKQVIKQVLAEYSKDNPSLGLAWVGAMLGQSSSEKGINNIFTLLEPAMFPGVFKGSFKSLRQGAQDVVQSSITSNPTRATAHAAAGNLEQAAIERTGKLVVDSVLGTRVTPVDEALQTLPTALRQDKRNFRENPGRMTEEAVTRMEARYKANEVGFVQAVKDRIAIQRTPDLLRATKEELVEFNEGIKRNYPGVSNSIVDISDPRLVGSTNVVEVDIILGKAADEFFSSFNQAKQWARANGIEDMAKPYSVGNKWLLKIPHTVKETDGFVKEMIKETKVTDVPESLMNAFVGWLRNPDETLSLQQRLERKAATYGNSNLIKLAKEEAKLIGKLGRSERSDLVRIMDASRRTIDPETGLPGYTYKNLPELDYAYMQTIKRLPSEKEIQAYFSYFRVNEMDRQYRKLLVSRNMLRAGVQQHQIVMKVPGGETYKGEFFNGIKHTRLPATDDTVVVIGKTPDEHKIWKASELVELGKYRKSWLPLKEKITNGSKVVLEVWDTETRPFYHLGKLKNRKVRYVVVDAANSKQIDFENVVPRRGGPHDEYDYQFYVKQAKIHKEKYGDTVRHDYEGDTTAFAVAVRQMGVEAVDVFNKVRIALREAQRGSNLYKKKVGLIDAQRLFESYNIAGISWKEFLKQFKGHKVDGVLHPPRFSYDEPFTLVERDQKIVDIDKSLETRYIYTNSRGEKINTFRNATQTGNPARELQVQFTGARDTYDLKAWHNEGGKHNPVFQLEPAKYVDALSTLDRSYTKAANSMWMDDYKIASVEHWLEQAKKWMKPTEQQLRASPFHWFHVGPGEFKSDAPKEIVKNLKIAHWQIQQFLGVRTETDALLHRGATQLADSLYNKFGSKGLVVDPHWLLPKLEDPFKFVRSVAFHAKLGMFAIPQLIVQAQTHSVMAGIVGGRNTAIAMGASFMTELTRLNANPKIIGHLDKLMTKLRMPGAGRWKPGEFQESLETLQRTGFMNVGQEYALRDSLQPKIITSPMGRFLDAGTVFFTEGERFSRISAWHAAYREFRDLSPNARLTQQNIKKILERADTLTVNMSRASSSYLHTGALALPTQFLSYQIRLAELMWGKRLTTMERAKVLGYQMALYGVPTGLGATGLPLGDIFRKSALENGYVVGENWIESLVTEGLPSAMIALLTGEGDMKKGTWLNVGDRFGAQGFETIREALRGDKTFWDIAGGAGYSVAKGFWDGSDGFREMVLSGLREDNKKVPMAPEDILDVFKEISSVNNTWKVIAALNTGKWFSKKEAYLDNTSATQAIIMGLTGLQPQSTSDLQLMAWSMKDKANLEKHVEQQFIQEFRRGIRIQTDQPEEARKYFTRAFAFLAIGDYPYEKRTGLIARAGKDYESLIESMNWSFYINNVAPSQREGRMKTYDTIKEIQRLRSNN